MKNLLCLVLSVIMTLSCFSCVAFAQDEIKVIINGNKLTMDQPPVLVNDRTLVPLRAIFEGLGASVTWDDATKTATGVKDGKEIKIAINQTTAYVDGAPVTLDVPAQLISDRTMVPVRFISENLGEKVDWDGTNKTVIITSESKLVKQWIFDDLTAFENNKDYILGGAYKAENVSLSTDVDHTTGAGKSLKLANRTSTSHRIKLKDVFSASDIGKTFTVKAWVYVPDNTSKIQLGAYSTTSTEYAMVPVSVTTADVSANTWTQIELVYKHENEIITQIGFDQGASKTIPLFYVDDIEIYEGTAAPVVSTDELTLKKTYKFDDLTVFENNKDYILGGGYKAENVSLSTDVDHTTGTGKALKMDNRTQTSHRLKLKDVFSTSDIGKTFTIKAWIYIPDNTSKIQLGAYSTTNTEYAMEPIASKEVNVGKSAWTQIELVYKHENSIITQIGFDQGASKTIPLFYIDDIEIYEGGIAPELPKEDEKEIVEVNNVTDGHRPVPTSFTKGKNYEDLIYYGTDKKSPEELLAALPEGKQIVGGNFIVDAITGAEQDRYDPNHGKLEAIDVTGMPFDKAVRATVYAPLDPPYTFQLSLGTPLAGNAEEGDVCLLRLWMRTESGGQGEAQMGSVMVVVEENGGAHAKTIAANVTNASEWKEFYFPFVFKDNFTSAKIRLAYYTQVVDLAGYTITNYGKDVKIEDLPTDSSSAPYLMPDAAWRKDAWDRIEQIRKGDFKVIVKDSAGNVIPNANVSVDMYDHEFEWGVAVNTPVLTDAKYQKALQENFNAAVLENHNKWTYYEKNPQETKDILQKIQDLGIYKIRGHVLLWDRVWTEGSSSVPDDLPSLHNDKEALQKRIKDHIDSATGELKQYIPYEWDVLNEAVRHHVIRDIYGVGIVKEWFDMARNAMGEEGRLYYNDFDRTDAEFALIQEYIDAGVDFDGIGIQSHYGSPENPETIYEYFEKISKFGKRLKVTEYDYSSTDFELQANFTRDFMITAFSHEAVDGFIMWGFRGQDKYVLYDKEYNPKPGLAVWQDLIYNKWWTNESGATGADGAFNTRGFYGDYDITVSAGGKEKTVTAQLYKGENNVVEIVLE